MTETASGPGQAGLRRLRRLVGGEGVKARALRGSFWTMSKFGGENVLRLASNLILTRLLFPEAFGMMAIVQVFIAGLQMFSDTGIRASIIQNERGDEPDFLNTAWTIQVGRGFLLWLGACALALPAAAIYDEPMLAQLLPVAGLNAVIAGFSPTAVFTANRHLMLGRVTAIDLSNQVMVIVIMVGLAWWLESVWALILGGLAGAVIRIGLYWMLLPGPRNRFRWERRAASQLFHFGKWIFLGTAAGFTIQHADRLILGHFITLSELGVYSIAYTLARVPRQLHGALVTKIVFPLYRLKMIPEPSAQNKSKLLRARRVLIFTSLALNACLAFVSVELVGLLYDPRYISAGPMVALFCLSSVPGIVLNNYTGIILAHGDSRRHLVLVGAEAVANTTLLILGTLHFGVVGAILAYGIARLLTAPLRTLLVKKYGALDPADWAFLSLGLVLGALVCWLHLEEIEALLGSSG